MNDPTTIIAALPVTTSDRLRVTFWNPSPDVQYSCYVRWLQRLKDGTLNQNAELCRIPASSQALEFAFPVSDGELLWCSIDAGASSLQDGSVYCSLALQSGGVDQASNLIQLTSGYLATGKPINYPLSPPRAANETPRALIHATITSPAAGDPAIYAFPAAALIEIINFSCQFDSAAGAAAREPYIILADTTGTLFETSSSGTIEPLSQYSIYYSQWPSTPSHRIYRISGVIPPHQAGPGAQLTVNALNILAADQISQLRLWYKSEVYA